MSSKISKQKDFSSVASNESQLTLVSLVADEHEEDGEGVPPPKGEPVQATAGESVQATAAVTSYSGPKIAPTPPINDHPARCSQVQPIFIVLVVATIILVVEASVPIVFYYVFVGQVCSFVYTNLV